MHLHGTTTTHPAPPAAPRRPGRGPSGEGFRAFAWNHDHPPRTPRGPAPRGESDTISDTLRSRRVSKSSLAKKQFPPENCRWGHREAPSSLSGPAQTVSVPTPPIGRKKISFDAPPRGESDNIGHSTKPRRVSKSSLAKKQFPTENCRWGHRETPSSLSGPAQTVSVPTLPIGRKKISFDAPLRGESDTISDTFRARIVSKSPLAKKQFRRGLPVSRWPQRQFSGGKAKDYLREDTRRAGPSDVSMPYLELTAARILNRTACSAQKVAKIQQRPRQQFSTSHLPKKLAAGTPKRGPHFPKRGPHFRSYRE